MSYLFLAVAIASEIFATSILKATDGFTRLWPSLGVIVGYGLAFYTLSLALKQLPLSVSYAIWSGIGTACTAVIGVIVWKQPLNAPMIAGIALIIAGVILLNLYKAGH